MRCAPDEDKDQRWLGRDRDSRRRPYRGRTQSGCRGRGAGGLHANSSCRSQDAERSHQPRGRLYGELHRLYHALENAKAGGSCQYPVEAPSEHISCAELEAVAATRGDVGHAVGSHRALDKASSRRARSAAASGSPRTLGSSRSKPNSAALQCLRIPSCRRLPEFELAICRLRPRRRPRRSDVHADRNRRAQRRRSASIARRSPRQPPQLAAENSAS